MNIPAEYTSKAEILAISPTTILLNRFYTQFPCLMPLMLQKVQRRMETQYSDTNSLFICTVILEIIHIFLA